MKKPFGTWISPLPAAVVAAQGLRLSAVAVDGEDLYWIEGRPAEGGRNVIVHCAPDGSTRDVVPAGFNARTRVHEYGGAAYAIAAHAVLFSNFSDQRIYSVPAARSQTGRAAPPVAVTPDAAFSYADLIVDSRRHRLIAIREDHSAPGEPVNSIVGIPLEGESAGDVIASGYDFYATPRLSPDGRRLSWLAWRHPLMPWDGTELWVADVDESGGLTNSRCIAGSNSESIYQPGWSPGGVLYFVSDRDGWWKLYREVRVKPDATHDGPVRLTPDATYGGSVRLKPDATYDAVRLKPDSTFAVAVEAAIADPPPDAEWGRPHWVFGGATWVFAGDSRIVASYTRRGRWYLTVVDVADGTWRRVGGDLEPREWLTATATHAVFVAASPTMADAIVRLALDTGTTEIVRSASDLRLDPADVSIAAPIEFPTGTNSVGHAFYYAPRNRRFTSTAAGHPPLVAIGHGGPTSAATATLDLRIQFWTTRGFAVVDVNYRGSTGYGRGYRRHLTGEWGIADVDDMVNAARHLVAEGKADPHRLVIRGGSAGGYTALAALTFHPGAFTAAASYYGISDLEVLARDTHKFESRYLDGLIGPYPAAQEIYAARSPIHYVDRISCPVILFQGLDDKVVPPEQSRRMADAVREKGLPVAYLEFAGEQHGFRRAETIVRSLEAELAFYGVVFGFEPADAIEPVAIDNRPEA